MFSACTVCHILYQSRQVSWCSQRYVRGTTYGTINRVSSGPCKSVRNCSSVHQYPFNLSLMLCLIHTVTTKNRGMSHIVTSGGVDVDYRVSLKSKYHQQYRYICCMTHCIPPVKHISVILRQFISIVFTVT